jgi:two-component sensor histidine kinase
MNILVEMSSHEKKEKKRFSTIRVVGLYTLFGAFWIIFSDNILRLLSPNPQTYQYLQTYKGLFYVIATAVLLLGLVKREFHLRDVMQSRLEEALEIQERLRQELHHRVKNNLQLVQSMLSLQRNELRNSGEALDAEDLLRRVSMRVQVPTLFHQKVLTLDDESLIRLDSYLEEIAAQYSMEYEEELSGHSIRTELEEMAVQVSRAVPVGVIVSELLMNAALHAFPGKDSLSKAAARSAHDSSRQIVAPPVYNSVSEGGPEVSLKGRNQGGLLVLKVEDNGVGFDRESLKKGLGYTLIEAMLRQLDGEIRYGFEGKTVVELRIPPQPPHSQHSTHSSQSRHSLQRQEV